MTIAPHFFYGAALATQTNSYPIAFGLGFVSHLFLDLIPHTDPGTFVKGIRRGNWPSWGIIYVLVETIAVAVTMILLFKNRSDFGLLLAGGFGGILIDILDNFPIKSLDKISFFKAVAKIHLFFHHSLEPKNWYWGLVTELIILGGSLWFLLKF